MPPSVQRELTIRAAPERVFDAWVDVGDLLSWYADAALVGRRPGGNWALGWYADPDTDAGYHALGTLAVLDRGRRLEVADLRFSTPEGEEWGPMRLSVLFEPAGEGGTRVIVIHEGLPEEPLWDRYAAGAGPAWERALADLRAWLEEGRKLPGR